MKRSEIQQMLRDDCTLAALREVEPAGAYRVSAHIKRPDRDMGYPYYRDGGDGYQQTLLSLKRLEDVGLVNRSRGAGVNGSDLWHSTHPPVELEGIDLNRLAESGD